MTFRKEVLDIKSEKKSLSSKLKSLELEATAAGVQLVNMTQENEKLKELLKKETKTVEQKNYDIKSVLNEKDSLKECLEVTLSELSTARIKREKEQIKVKEEKKLCTLCTLEFDAYSDLKNHLRTSHVKNKETQTFMTALSESKFEQYTCFYYDKMIISEQVLEAHKIACHGAFSVILFAMCVALNARITVILGGTTLCSMDPLPQRNSVNSWILDGRIDMILLDTMI